MLQNKILHKKEQMEKKYKEEYWGTLKICWIFQINKKGVRENSNQNGKAPQKWFQEDQYTPSFKAANMLRKMGTDPWLGRA